MPAKTYRNVDRDTIADVMIMPGNLKDLEIMKDFQTRVAIKQNAGNGNGGDEDGI